MHGLFPVSILNKPWGLNYGITTSSVFSFLSVRKKKAQNGIDDIMHLLMSYKSLNFTIMVYLERAGNVYIGVLLLPL